METLKSAHVDEKLKGREIYGLAQARRSKVVFDDAAKEAKRWAFLWNVIAYTFDAIVALSAIVIIIASQISLVPTVVMTVMGGIVGVLKGIEMFGNFKARAATFDIVRQNYTTVAGKIEDAFAVLERIATDGVSSDEVIMWSKMTRMIEEMVHLASSWTSPGKTKVNSVTLAIDQLQTIEASILRDHQLQQHTASLDELGVDSKFRVCEVKTWAKSEHRSHPRQSRSPPSLMVTPPQLPIPKTSFQGGELSPRFCQASKPPDDVIIQHPVQLDTENPV